MVPCVSDAARDGLVADGYRFVTGVPVVESDFDSQGHLNNAAIARMFNDLRVAYVRGEVGAFWTDMLLEERYVVAARELHVLYESEGMPGETYLGAMRYTRWEGKAGIIEQRIVEASSARPLARAWVVQLLARDGRAIEWPARYYERVCEIEGRTVERQLSRKDRSFGPPQ
jgi:acyl-CoA thioesterase FadM